MGAQGWMVLGDVLAGDFCLGKFWWGCLLVVLGCCSVDWSYCN